MANNYMLNDKFPKSIKNATSTNDGLMSAQDKASLDSMFEHGLLSPVTPDKDGIMTKEDKVKLDSIEAGVKQYIHPDNENVRHVSDAQINKWDTQTKYTNSIPMPTTIGGLEKGTTFNNVDFHTLITKLLYPYIEPTISNINITPSTTIVEKGYPFNISRIRFNITTPSLQSNDSIHYDFKSNSNIFKSLDTTNRSIDITVNETVRTDSSITVEVIDKINDKTKTFSLINYIFVYPMYYGVISATDIITSSLISSKSKLINQKGTKTLEFTTNNEKMMIAYPKIYGDLTAIYDENNFNVLSTFTRTEINIITADSNTVQYLVYVNDISTVSDYNMRFIF